MKVAIVSFGHADCAIPMSKALAQKGILVDLYFTFSLNRKRNNIVDFEHVKVTTGLQPEEILHKAFSSEIYNYIDGHFKLQLFIYKGLKFKSLSNWLLSIKFSQILKNYDIIHFNGEHGILLQLILCLLRKKLIYTIHDYETHSGEGANKLLHRLKPFILKSKWQSIIQNQVDFNRIVDMFPQNTDKIHYVPFGYLDIYREYLGNGNTLNHKSDILFFGRISAYKGIDYLIDAIKIVKKTIPKIKVIIAGSGKFHFDISPQEKDPSFIIMNRFISTEELVNLIKSTKVVVCPYLDATQSGVVMTSYALNKPVIATNVGGFPDVIHENINGLLVPPRDSENLANAIIKLIKKPGILEKMSQNIKRNYYDGPFAWQTIADKIVSIYEQA